MAGAPTWKIYYDSAQTFWNSDWPKTISLLARAEKSALSDLGIYDDNYLTIVNDLALAYTHTNDYSTAEKLFTKIIAARTELGNISDSEYTNAVMNLANVYAETAKVKQAAALYKKLMSSSTPETPDHQKAGESLLRLYESNDQLDSAMLVANKLKSQARANDDNTAFELTLAQGRLNRKLRKYDEAKTILEYLASYDNSPANPLNPDPTRPVPWGQQVWDEMHSVYMTWTAVNDMNRNDDEPIQIPSKRVFTATR